MTDERPSGNLNHPVTSAMKDQWHKIAALLIARTGKRRIVITPREVEAAMNDPRGINITVKFTDEGIILGLVDDAEAARLSREEGGLPA